MRQKNKPISIITIAIIFFLCFLIGSWLLHIVLDWFYSFIVGAIIMAGIGMIIITDLEEEKMILWGLNR